MNDTMSAEKARELNRVLDRYNWVFSSIILLNIVLGVMTYYGKYPWLCLLQVAVCLQVIWYQTENRNCANALKEIIKRKTK